MASIDGRALSEILLAAAKHIEANKDFLCELDSEVGDGDHGVSMTIGMRAARQNLECLESPTPAQAFRAVSLAFADEVGASIGPLYEEAFEAAASVVDGDYEISGTEGWTRIVTCMSDAMRRTGGAEPGDKTLVDAWFPAAQAMCSALEQGWDPAAALSSAAAAAWKGVEETRDLIPRRGRASRLGERARGFQDAGATSASMIIEALAKGVSKES
jgi:dihydroxyacetone kinase-like protein